MLLLLLAAALLTAGGARADTPPKGLPPGVSSENLLFYASYNSQSPTADVAGGKPESLNFTRTLQYFQAPGVVQAGLGTLQNESCRYALPGNLDPRQGTVGLWVRAENWTPADRRAYAFFAAEIPGAYRLLLAKPAAEAAVSLSLELLKEGKRCQVSAPVAWPAKSWHRLDASWDARGLALFVDGAPAGRTPLPEGATLPASAPEGFLSVNPNNYFSGKECRPEDLSTVDEVAVYGRVLTPAEIAGAFSGMREGFFPARRNPLISVPLDRTPVTLDGRLDAAEWARASRVPIQSLGGRVAFSGRPAWALLKYDDKGLTLGFHAGGDSAPVARIRQHDGYVWEDGAFETVFEAAPDVRVQFAINSANVVFDMKNNDAGWNGITQTAAARDGDGWSAEVLLPYAAIGAKPPAPGTTWGANFMYDWDQRLAGYATWSPFILKTEGFFANPTCFGSLLFAGEQEGVRVLALGELAAGAVDARVGLSSPGAAGIAARCVVGSDQGCLRDQTAPLGAQDAAFQCSAPKGSEGILSLTVTGAQGRKLAVYDQAFAVKPPLVLAPKYLPSANALAVSLDFTNLDAANRDRLTAGKLPITLALLDASGKPLAAAEGAPTTSPASLSLGLPRPVPPGAYRLRASFPSGSGTHAEEMPLEIPPFDFLTAKAGMGHDVPDPWVPVKAEGDSVRVLNREYRLDGSPFPAQMTSLGKPLLKTPFRLILETAAGPERFVWKPRRAGAAFTDSAAFTGQGMSERSGVTASWDATAEFEGLWLTHLTLRPAGKPVTVRALTLEFDVDRASAEHVLALLSRPWEKDTVRLDLFHNIDSVVGRESPHGGFWLTGMKTGLYFFTTTDGNWVVPAREPNAFITRRADRVSVKVTIITKPVVLKQAASYEFGVSATPARVRAAKSFGSGDHEYVFQVGKWQNWTSLVPLQPEALRQSIAEKKKKDFKFFYEYTFPGIIDEDPYYAFWNPYWKGCPNSEGQADLVAYRVENLARDFGVGPYFDMCSVSWCDNPDHGCGYTDAFGKKAHTIPVLGLRRLLLRSYRIAHHYGCKVWNHNHSMFLPAAHVFSDLWFPGEQYTSEIVGDNHFYSRTVKRDDYRVEMNPFLHGMSMVFLPEVGRAYDLAGYKDWEKWQKAESQGYAEQVLAMVLPHDIDCLGAYIYPEPVKKVYEILKAEGIARRENAPGPAPRYTGYWENPPVKVDDAQVTVGCYTFPGENKVVAVLSNPTLKPVSAKLLLDRKRLGLVGAGAAPLPLVVRDAYRSRELPAWESGIRIPAESFVLLVIRPGTPGKGSAAPPEEAPEKTEATAPEAVAEGVNLLKNPGFEETATVNAAKDYAPMLARGVEVPGGEAATMPAGWGPNPSDGWLQGQKGCLRYVEGEAGKEVHSGRRALYLSCLGHGAVAASPFSRVQAEAMPDQPSLSLTKPNRFRLWAKGRGKLMVYAYTYDQRRSNIYGKTRSTPESFTLTDTWQPYEGAIEFLSPEVGHCLFVVAVSGGEVTVDDVELRAQ